MSEKQLPLVIVVGEYADETSRQALRDVGAELRAVDVRDVDLIPDMDPVAILLWHTTSMGADFLSRMQSLKLLVRMGVGFDNVDIQTAGQLSIAVCNCATYGTEEVADSAMSHILNIYRQTSQLEAWTHRNEPLTNAKRTRDLCEGTGVCRIRGQKLGIVGLGCIGTAVLQRARPFGFDISFFDPYIPVGIERGHGVRRHATLEDLLQESDVVTFHCNQMEGNEHMLNADTIALMKRGARVVNVARGGLIDEAALAAALRSGQVSYAALDVHEREPYVRSESPFADIPNSCCLPHVAWYSPQALADIWRIAVGEVKCAVLPTGKHVDLKNCVNRHSFRPDGIKWIG